MKARQAKRDAQALQLRLDRVQAQGAEAAAAAASGELDDVGSSVVQTVTLPTVFSGAMYLLTTTDRTAAFQPSL